MKYWISVPIIVCVLLTCLAESRAQNAQSQVRLYDDPRVQTWSKSFLDNKREQVLQSVEQDLKSASPHPLAPHVWTITQDSLGRLKAAWEALQDEQLRKALGVLPELWLLYNKGEYNRVIERFPAATALEIKDCWALHFRAWSSINQGQFKEAFQFLVAASRVRPDFIRSAWALIELADKDESMRTQIEALVGPGGEFEKAPVGRFLVDLLRFRPIGTLDRLAALNAWLTDHPKDARAMALKADQLYNIERYTEAKDAYASAMEGYPFIYFDDDRAKTLLRLGKKDDARKAVERHAALNTKDATEAAPETEWDWAIALINTGDEGGARKVLEAAIKRWPDHAGLNTEFAQLELNSNRPAQAITYARKAAEAERENLSYQLRLIEALEKANKLQDALAHFVDTEKRFNQKSENLYYRGGEVLQKLKRMEDYVRNYERAAAEYPRSSWMNDNFAFGLGKIEKPKEALERLRKSYDIVSPSQWRIDKIRELHTQIEGNELAGGKKADAELFELRKRYPADEQLWQDAVKHVDSRDKAQKKIEIWKQAIAANPGRYWPWDNLNMLLTSEERWDEARQAANEAMNAVKDGPPGDRTSAILDLIWLTTSRLQKDVVDQQELKDALNLIEQYRDSGGVMSSYHRFRSDVFSAMGRKNDAAKEKEQQAELRPDDNNLMWELVTKYANELGTGRVMWRFHQMVERDPYDGPKLGNLLRLKVMWYVSPVAALEIADLIKERAPDYASKSLEADAWKAMGDYPREYQVSYSNSTSISNSNRYIGWYETTRLSSQKGRLEIELDKREPGVYQITHEDGTVVRYKRHTISGKYELMQVGAAKVTCEYDETGSDLQRVFDSAGNEIRLTYNQDHQIEVLKTTKGDEITFQYNDAGKPTKIALTGVGEINVTYTPSGEIQKVDSSAGRAIALKVTSAFQELLDLIRPFGGADPSKIPELPFNDSKLDDLRRVSGEKQLLFEQQPTPATQLASAQAGMAVARYLIEHIGDRRGYAEDARTILDELIEATTGAKAGAQLAALGVETIKQWRLLAQAVHKKGLSADDWKQWSDMREWLTVQAAKPTGQQAKALLRDNDTHPLTLLKLAAWMPNSYLNSPGYWHRFHFAEVLPSEMRRAVQLQTVLVRRNNEVVIGSERGLHVLRRGYWEWFGFDESLGKFSKNAAREQVSAASNIVSLAEDDSGTLWVGTASGLVQLKGAYDGEAKRWSTADGLPVARVDHMAAQGNRLFIGTAKGLLSLSDNRIIPHADFSSEEITLLKPAEGKNDLEAQPLIVGTATGLAAIVKGKKIQLSDKPVSDAEWDVSTSKFFLLRGGELYTVTWGSDNPPGQLIYVQDQNMIVKTNRIYGLSRVPLDGGAIGIGVMTDRGISIYYKDHFEHKDLPLADKSVGVFASAHHGARMYMLTSEGVYTLERGQTMGDARGRVYDLLTMDELGLTFVARGNQLEVVRNSNPEAGALPFAQTYTTHLAKDSQGRLIANDDYEIVRFEKGSAQSESLFTMKQTLADGWNAGRLTSLLAASDGTIWATVGASVFRWKDGELEEFTIFKDSKKFPSRSEMISRVIETYDGRIWVVASDEGHLYFNGQKLEGGLLEWTGSGFRRLDLPEQKFSWFITGYTKVSDSAAIVGTTDGFVQHQNDRYAHYKDFKDITYDQLQKRTPMLWLGTRGAKLGEDLWLFGTAGGVVAWKAGEWFYPDALNWKLPDDYKFGGNYGVRTVHAVATDKAGHIYAGNDRGLLIYDSGGADTSSFLVSNHFEREYVFRLAEQQKLRQEADIFLNNLPKDSELSKMIEQVRKAETEIEQIKSKLAPGVRLVPIVRAAAPAGGKQDSPAGPGDIIAALGAAEQADLARLLEAKIQAHNRLLLQLQKENPGFYQLLELKPLDLVSLRKELDKHQAIVQYLPTEKNLYIQVVTRENITIREVKDVKGIELQQRARRATEALRRSTGARGPKVAGDSSAAPDPKVLTDDLAWLYEQLLAPVEEDLKEYSNVFIVPVGQLSYVPFSALIRSKEPKIEYAVERFNLGYLSSMYLFDLVMRSKRARNADALIFGDPDGTLPGAREEVKSVRKFVGGSIEPFIGNDASYETLKQYCSRVGYLHLATHGHLYKPTPEDSWLQLANQRRLSLIEAMSLPLDDVEMVVLSACETGLAADGMEYATLARSFAQAGAPAVIATLWQVDDNASRALMEKFYEFIAQRDDRFTALAKAQRYLLSSGNEAIRGPAAWSGYIPFGKP